MSLSFLFNLLEIYAFYLLNLALCVQMDFMDDWVSFDEMEMNVMVFVKICGMC